MTQEPLALPEPSEPAPRPIHYWPNQAVLFTGLPCGVGATAEASTIYRENVNCEACKQSEAWAKGDAK